MLNENAVPSRFSAGPVIIYCIKHINNLRQDIPISAFPLCAVDAIICCSAPPRYRGNLRSTFFTISKNNVCLTVSENGKKKWSANSDLIYISQISVHSFYSKYHLSFKKHLQYAVKKKKKT